MTHTGAFSIIKLASGAFKRNNIFLNSSSSLDFVKLGQGQNQPWRAFLPFLPFLPFFFDFFGFV